MEALGHFICSHVLSNSYRYFVKLRQLDNYIMATSLTGIFNKKGLDISMIKEEVYVSIRLDVVNCCCLSIVYLIILMLR